MDERPQVQVLFVLAVGLAIAVASSGCGQSALAAHARTALVLRSVNDGAVTAIEATCRTRGVAAASNPDVDHATAVANTNRIRVRCELAANAQHLFASALNTYTDQLLAAVTESDESAGVLDRIMLLAYSLVPLYGDMVRVAADLGLEIPAVPAPLRALTERN